MIAWEKNKNFFLKKNGGFKSLFRFSFFFCLDELRFFFLSEGKERKQKPAEATARYSTGVTIIIVQPWYDETPHGPAERGGGGGGYEFTPIDRLLSGRVMLHCVADASFHWFSIAAL